MISLKPNLVKRIQRLPKPKNTATAMQPLFEAISNSIHSVQSKFGDQVRDLGQITVTINTSRKKAGFSATVDDNGIGLDQDNWDAFITTDTDNKLTIGGKGVGRLLWLDCFKKIHVISVCTQDGQMVERQFDFVLKNDNQIENYSERSGVTEEHSSFKVRFDGLNDNGYESTFPGRGNFIFQHLISHFLPTFIGDRCPSIEVIVGEESQHFPKDIDKIVFRKDPDVLLETSKFGLLTLTMMECDKVASADLKGSHFVHFIAHDRTVVSQKIDGKLGLKYFGENENRVFHAIVKGDYLDQNVNQERTAFNFEDSVLDQLINDACIKHVEKFLEVPLTKLMSEQQSIIHKITETYPSVAFGDTAELQEKIPSGELSGDAIFGHLSRERYRRDVRQAERIRDVLSRLKNNEVSAAEFNEAIKNAGKAIEDAEQRSLAEYVVRRKVVLDFIEILLQKVRDDASDSSYQREDVLHSFICPLRINTLESGHKKVESAASHDLWIVDERLTFAQYFSSDVKFSALSEASENDQRSDVLIFDYVHGLRQKTDASKVLLIEFKRPGRTSYAADENPQDQIQNYIRELQSGKISDVKGRPVKLNRDTVFNCFVIADIVGKLDDWTFTWQRTADGRGRIYQPLDGFRGSIELIGWDALLSDARERNQAFFEMAGISGESFFSL